MAKKPGYVYVAEDTSKPSHYKIGQSTDPDQRERTLRGAGLARTINIVKRVQVDDMDAVEHAFHEILKPHRVRGEWFNINLDQVIPMFEYLSRLHAGPKPVGTQRPNARHVPGEWHEEGWKMHCEGATEAAIAQKFGVTRGAVAAMKRKMRRIGRGDEEWNRPSNAGERKEQPQGGTPLSAFNQPIKKVLKRLGGRARAEDVLSGIEKVMNLSQADRKKLKTGHIVWRKKASWAAHQLKRVGDLKPDSEWGWWELP